MNENVTIRDNMQEDLQDDSINSGSDDNEIYTVDDDATVVMSGDLLPGGTDADVDTLQPGDVQNYLTLQQAITPFRSLLVMWLVLNTFISVWQIWKPIKRTLWKIRLITPLLWKALKQKLMI